MDIRATNDRQRAEFRYSLPERPAQFGPFDQRPTVTVFPNPFASAMDYETENGRYDEKSRYDYDQDRDRSASPRPMSDTRDRDRSISPHRPDNRGPPPGPDGRNDKDDDDDGSHNPGSNLFVTGIHPRLTENDVSRLFSKYGEVDKCAIMLDPHTREPRGFGFVKMMTAEEADAAKEGLQGEVIEGRTLSIEKARRSRPRTPTPGKYFGPPKREFGRGPPRGGRYDRYDDRRGGLGGRRDDGYRSGGRYDSYYDRRDDRRGGGRPDSRYDSYYDRRDDYRSGGRYDSYNDRRDDGYRSGGRGIDRYAGGRDDRPSREPREPFGGRSFNDPAPDRYGDRRAEWR